MLSRLRLLNTQKLVLSCEMVVYFVIERVKIVVFYVCHFVFKFDSFSLYLSPLLSRYATSIFSFFVRLAKQTLAIVYVAKWNTSVASFFFPNSLSSDAMSLLHRKRTAHTLDRYLHSVFTSIFFWSKLIENPIKFFRIIQSQHGLSLTQNKKKRNVWMSAMDGPIFPIFAIQIWIQLQTFMRKQANRVMCECSLAFAMLQSAVKSLITLPQPYKMQCDKFHFYVIYLVKCNAILPFTKLAPSFCNYQHR